MVSAARPRSPSTGSSPPPPLTSDKGASIDDASKSHPQRRSSLGILLRRSKSGDLGSKGRKSAHARELELQRQQREEPVIPKSPPRLPDLYNGVAPPELQTFGGDTSSSTPERGRASMDRSRAGGGNVPVPPIPNNVRTHGEYVDPYARTESMTHRGRYSYASSAVSTINSPRRVRRRKDPTPFNILILGTRSAGKTSFLEFLKLSLALPAKKRGTRINEPEEVPPSTPQHHGTFVSHYLETEIDGERVGLTLWDSEGLEKNVVDLQLREMSSFLESKFEETFTEEMKVVRAPGVQDTHIHCAFLILDPVRLDKNIADAKKGMANSHGMNGGHKSTSRITGGLDEDLDLQVMRMLQGKTTVVPVIAKADTITTAHMSFLKKMVWDSLRQAKIDPLEALGLDDGEPESPTNPNRIDERDEYEVSDLSDDNEIPGQSAPEAAPNPSRAHIKRPSTGSIRRHKPAEAGEDPSEIIPYLPLSVLSPDIYEPGVIGRKFPWGFADPMNEEHCDFVKLKEAVFSDWRGELREASREMWYEGWRTSRLKHRDTRH